jgi:hypothetical protein
MVQGGMARQAVGPHRVGPHRAGPDRARARARAGPGGPFGHLYVQLVPAGRLRDGNRVIGTWMD